MEDKTTLQNGPILVNMYFLLVAMENDINYQRSHYRQFRRVFVISFQFESKFFLLVTVCRLCPRVFRHFRHTLSFSMQ